MSILPEEEDDLCGGYEEVVEEQGEEGELSSLNDAQKEDSVLDAIMKDDATYSQGYESENENHTPVKAEEPRVIKLNATHGD